MFKFIAIFPLLFLLFKAEALVATAYGQLSSLTTQMPTSAGANLVKMEVADELLNIDLSPQKTKLIIKEDGVYFIMASGQVGAVSSGASGYVDLWLVKNDKQVPNSNCRITINDSAETDVLISQAALTLKTGDTISSGFSSSGPSLGFIFTQPDNEPAIVSFLFSIFKLSDSPKGPAPASGQVQKSKIEKLK